MLARILHKNDPNFEVIMCRSPAGMPLRATRGHSTSDYCYSHNSQPDSSSLIASTCVSLTCQSQPKPCISEHSPWFHCLLVLGFLPLTAFGSLTVVSQSSFVTNRLYFVSYFWAFPLKTHVLIGVTQHQLIGYVNIPAMAITCEIVLKTSNAVNGNERVRTKIRRKRTYTPRITYLFLLLFVR